MDRFSYFFCVRLEIEFFEIFLNAFLKNRTKKFKIAEISGLKITITNAAIILVARDIDHRILDNFLDNLSLT